MDFLFAEDVLSAVTREECAVLASQASGKRVLEIGSWVGRSTIALASTARIVHAVDWHRGDPHAGTAETLPSFVSNLSRYGVRDKVVIHVGRNEEVLPFLLPKGFEMVFLDSFHERTAVEKDLESAWALLRPSGILACHDYGIRPAVPIPFGVTEAVDAFVKRRNLAKELTGTLMVLRERMP